MEIVQYVVLFKDERIGERADGSFDDYFRASEYIREVGFSGDVYLNGTWVAEVLVL